MKLFWLSQLDYIFFFYGLSFILLGTCALALTKIQQNVLHTRYLAAFGFVHGALEWMDLIALSVGDNLPFQWVRLIFMTVSFVFLFEFGRENTLAFRKQGPRSDTALKTAILYFVVLVISCLGGFWGFGGLRSSIRYGFGLLGGLWAAWVFAQAALRVYRVQVKRHLWASAILMAFYAITAGFITTKAPFVPALWINHDSFLSVFSFPIQLVRGILATALAVSGFSLVSLLRAESLVAERMLTSTQFLLKGYRLVALVLVCFILGAFATQSQQREEEEQLGEFLLRRAQIVANLLDPHAVEQLAMPVQGGGIPEVPYFKEAFDKIFKANSDVGRIVLYGYTNTKEYTGFIYYGVSTTDRLKFLIKPGTPIRDEVSAEELQFFQGRIPYLINKESDSWGNWISTSLPLAWNIDGTVQVALSLDVDDREWRSEIALNRLIVIGIVLLICLLILLTYLFLSNNEEARRRVEEGEVKYRAIVENTQDALFILVADQILFSNPKAHELTGYSEAELGRLALFDLVKPEEHVFLRGLLEKGSGGNASLQFIRKDKALRATEVFPQMIQIGRLKALLLVVRDVTDRAELQNQLMHSEKLASIGTLAAGVAHEINNPLMIIKGNVSVMRDQTENKEFLGLLEKQERAVARIAQIVNSLRTYARPDTEHKGPIDINSVIQDTMLLISPIFSKSGIHLNVSLAPSKPIALGNVGKLQQVIMNLVNNAKDALENVEDPHIDISTCVQGKKVEVIIADNGPGIPEHLLRKVFDPFFTTKAPGKGTGLGLAICQSIVQSFEGTMAVHSLPGKGATFTVELPLQSAGDLAGADLTKSDPEISKKIYAPQGAKMDAAQFSGTVLVADDEEDIREILGKFLKKIGFTVAFAENGEIALQMLKAGGEQYRYLLSDMKMPKLNGFQLVQEAAKLEKCKNMKLVIMTGGVTTDFSKEQRDTMRQVAHGYLLKPFDRGTIVNLFSKLEKNITAFD